MRHDHALLQRQVPGGRSFGQGVGGRELGASLEFGTGRLESIDFGQELRREARVAGQWGRGEIGSRAHPSAGKGWFGAGGRLHPARRIR